MRGGQAVVREDLRVGGRWQRTKCIESVAYENMITQLRASGVIRINYSVELILTIDTCVSFSRSYYYIRYYFNLKSMYGVAKLTKVASSEMSFTNKLEIKIKKIHRQKCHE